MLSDRCLSVCLVTLMYRGHTVGWIKMPHGREIGLGPGDSVRWGPCSPRKGAQQSPTFRPMLIVDKPSPMSETAELLLLLKA